MTFSISARCVRSGALGIAICSSSPAVAARCAHARAGVGVVATQNVTDPRLGPRGLDLMPHGATQALEMLVADTPDISFRQLALVDRRGGTAVYSGRGALGRHGATAIENVAVAGNLLAGDAVLPAMLESFLRGSAQDLGDRLVAALQAAAQAGGEAGPVRSAGLIIVSAVAWPVADLRVDWHDDPVAALASLWEVWKPLADGYVTRALTPASAPSFGVAGDR